MAEPTRQQRRYARLLAAGLCVNCGEKKEPEIKTLKCIRCRDISRAASRRCKAQKKETKEVDELAAQISSLESRVNQHEEMINQIVRSPESSS